MFCRFFKKECFLGQDQDSKIRNSLYIQPYNGKWFLYTVKSIYLRNEFEEILPYAELKDQEYFSVKNADKEYKIFVEFVAKAAFINHNYLFLERTFYMPKYDYAFDAVWGGEKKLGVFEKLPSQLQ